MADEEDYGDRDYSYDDRYDVPDSFWHEGEEPSDGDEPWYIRVREHFYWPTLVTFVLAIFAAIFLPKSNSVNEIVAAALLLSTLFLFIHHAEPDTSHAYPFDPPYDKRWFVPIIVCLFVIIFAGFTLAALTGPTQIGQVTFPTSIWNYPKPFGFFNAYRVYRAKHQATRLGLRLESSHMVSGDRPRNHLPHNSVDSNANANSTLISL